MVFGRPLGWPGLELLPHELRDGDGLLWGRGGFRGQLPVAPSAHRKVTRGQGQALHSSTRCVCVGGKRQS